MQLKVECTSAHRKSQHNFCCAYAVLYGCQSLRTTGRNATWNNIFFFFSDLEYRASFPSGSHHFFLNCGLTNKKIFPPTESITYLQSSFTSISQPNWSMNVKRNCHSHSSHIYAFLKHSDYRTLSFSIVAEARFSLCPIKNWNRKTTYGFISFHLFYSIDNFNVYARDIQYTTLSLSGMHLPTNRK